MDFEEKFWAKVTKQEDGCWIFNGALTLKAPHGYGKLYNKGSAILAHRYSYYLHKGDIGDNKVLHKCDVRQCVNPEHLFLGTLRDNNVDRAQKGRSAYGTNHGRTKLTEENVKYIKENLGIITQDNLAKMFGVTRGAIRGIVTGNNWRHL